MLSYKLIYTVCLNILVGMICIFVLDLKDFLYFYSLGHKQNLFIVIFKSHRESINMNKSVKAVLDNVVPLTMKHNMIAITCITQVFLIS